MPIMMRWLSRKDATTAGTTPISVVIIHGRYKPPFLTLRLSAQSRCRVCSRTINNRNTYYKSVSTNHRHDFKLRLTKLSITSTKPCLPKPIFFSLEQQVNSTSLKYFVHQRLIGTWGYIGGSVLLRFLKHPDASSINITVLVRSPEKAEKLKAFGVNPVVGSHSDTPLVEELTAQADVVIAAVRTISISFVVQ